MNLFYGEQIYYHVFFPRLYLVMNIALFWNFQQSCDSYVYLNQFTHAHGAVRLFSSP
jgi:hypothetical protein